MGILNIAHRGYSGKFDENTMLAFKKAIEYKADGIETDVQLSKDDIPVIIHDETLDRTTNGHGFVSDYTLDELKIFRTKSVPRVQSMKTYALEEVEHSKIGQYTVEEIEYLKNRGGEEIPTLRELLELVANSNLKVLNLELKNSVIEYNGIEEKVLNLIDEFNLKDRVIISSFNHMSLVKIREIEAGKIKINKNLSTERRITLGALTDSTLVNVPKYLKTISVECYHPYFPSILNKAYMEEIKKAGIRVNPYTVNEVGDMKKVIEVGANSIITNEVELLDALIMERF